jgi:hypothetical protein
MSRNSVASDLYRIDRAHEEVYKKTSDGYLFAFSFYQLGVTKRARKQTILRAIQEEEHRQLYLEEN